LTSKAERLKLDRPRIRADGSDRRGVSITCHPQINPRTTTHVLAIFFAAAYISPWHSGNSAAKT
jgi:hypothetical protein